jgi:hypothetical protein
LEALAPTGDVFFNSAFPELSYGGPLIGIGLESRL